MKKIGFIDYYLDEWHANNYPDMIKKAYPGEFEVSYAFGLIDSPKGGMTNRSWAEKNGITLCESIEELVEKSDYLTVLSPDNSEMHEELCKIPLKSGKNTFVDKTFAPTREIAERIFDYADKNGTKCYSSSAVPFADEYKKMPSDIKHITSFGGGVYNIYAVHQIEPILALTGGKVAKIMYQGGTNVFKYAVVLEDGRTAELNFLNCDMPFSMHVLTDKNEVSYTEIQSDFFGNAIRAMLDFFKTGEIPVSHERTLNTMSAIECLIKAHEKPFTWIDA